jgi:TolB protein
VLGLRIFKLIIISALLSFSLSAQAMLSLELTKGVYSAVPITIVPFSAANDFNLAGVITQDLQHSGRFKIIPSPTKTNVVDRAAFQKLGVNNIVTGTIRSLSDDQYEFKIQLLDAYSSKDSSGILLSKRYTFRAPEARVLAHRVSDVIYQQITGVQGIFSTKLAYVVVRRLDRISTYSLEVADQDGFNPHMLLRSNEPIMSPAWSPNGKMLAYVSFEKRRAAIYTQDIASGSRRLISVFPGINGAPAWSPDGSQLAVVLSKSGSPNIYLLNVTTGALKALTHDFYLNTEPSWSPDGSTLLFTSNRSGNVQVYTLNLQNNDIRRLTYDGDYNARASYTRDGKKVTLIHRVNGVYNIGLLDVDTGHILVLTHSSADSTSPSAAPNGSMVLYDTIAGNRSLLGMVSNDAKIQLVLPALDGDAQDPAWSPFL